MVTTGFDATHTRPIIIGNWGVVLPDIWIQV